MNILFLGKTLLAHRLSSALSKDGISVTHLVDMPLAYSRIKEKKFDLVIVDSLLEKADDVCDEICNFTRIPIVLILNEAETNWKSICNIDTDGFLTEDASDNELVARVKAVFRRNTLILKAKNLTT
jgi:DNA-binding response OmpR family regulator